MHFVETDSNKLKFETNSLNSFLNLFLKSNSFLVRCDWGLNILSYHGMFTFKNLRIFDIKRISIGYIALQSDTLTSFAKRI